MAVKFYFQKDKYGLEEIELKRLTLIHGGTFRQRREILLSIYALFKVLEYVREGRFADNLWEEISFEYRYTGYGRQVPLCISMETEVLARALENLYRHFAGQLMREWLGYTPPLPKLELVPEHTDSVSIGLAGGEGVEISVEGKDIFCPIDDCSTFSFRRAFAEYIIVMFDEVFMKASSEFYPKHGETVYFPVGRQKLFEIHRPLNIPDWKKVKAENIIGYFCDILEKHFIEQIKPANSLIREFVRKCAVPVALMWTLRGIPFKFYEFEFISDLFKDRELGFTEGFVPVLKDEKGDIPPSKAEDHVKDIACLLAILDCLSVEKLLVEEVDRHVGCEHQDIIKMLFDELLGFDVELPPFVKISIQLFATCEGDYLPWQFEDYDKELTGIYRLS